MKRSLALSLALLAGNSYASTATTQCDGSATLFGGDKYLEGRIAEATIALQGEVIAVEQHPAVPAVDSVFPGYIGHRFGTSKILLSGCCIDGKGAIKSVRRQPSLSLL
jgi:hypothetical protein